MAFDFDVVYRYGDVITVPYTPSGADVAAGDVVVVGDIPMIATRPILDGELGGLNARGGVYHCKGDAVIAAGKRVYWNNATGKVTETPGALKIFGNTVGACAGDGSLVEVNHDPGLDLLV